MQKQIALAIAKVILSIELHSSVGTAGFDFKIAVQKIGYIMSKVGCDIGLKFSWYTLGPYSRTLQNHYGAVAGLLDRAINDEDLEIRLSNELEVCTDKVIEFLREFKRYLGGFDIRSLEVLASLIMLCSDIYPKPDNPIEELMKRKKGVSRDVVEKAWKFLIDRSICT